MKYTFPLSISGSQIKIWSNGYVAFAGQFKLDTTITDSYGAATYKIEGNKYEESILYHDYTAPTGITAKILIEVWNDTLIQTYSVGDDWKINENTCCIEKYVRLK